jgi:Holliday junction resolvase RusA-like endonuclease
MADDDTMYPLEVVLQGTPLSQQSKSATNRRAWRQRVTEAALKRRQETYELGLLDQRPLEITIYYFPDDPMEGDVDNIVKPILDAMVGVAFLDDRVIERVTAQKFEPGCDWAFFSPSERLDVALGAEPPVVYIRVNDDLSWRKIR